MHSNHAPTWETTLVIPEAVKSVEEKTLDALLRIEGLLQGIIDGGIPRPITPVVLKSSADKGLDVEFTSEELQELRQVRETTKPAKKAKAK